MIVISNFPPFPTIVAVIGTGGVGLNTIQSARIAGAAKIIALSRKTKRLETAMEFGATHALRADSGDVTAQVKELTSKKRVSIPQALPEPLSISAGVILAFPEASSCTVIS